MGKLRKVLKIGCLTVLTLVVLGVTGLALFVWHARRTAPPWPERVTGVRLEPSRPFLREADVKPDNAYYYIRQLTNWQDTLKIPQDEMLKFRAYGYRPNAYPQLEAWLITNAPALQLVAQAAAMTNAQVATFNFNDSISYVSPVMNIGKMLPFRVQQSAQRHEWSAVTNDFQQTLRLAQHISRGGALINALVDISSGMIACSAARELALEPQLPVAVALNLASILHAIEMQQEPFVEILRQECLVACSELELLQKPFTVKGCELKSCYSLAETTNESVLICRPLLHILGSTPERMRTHWDALHSHIIAAALNPRHRTDHFASINAVVAPPKDLFALLFGDDPLGRIFIATTEPALEYAFDKQMSNLAALRGTQIFLAICAYRQEHDGQLPRTLGALVPAYLPKLPADPFDPAGGTFHYRLEKDHWLIWSLGPDQKDDGGRFNWLDYSERFAHKDQADVIFASAEFSKARERLRQQLEKQQAVKK